MAVDLAEAKANLLQCLRQDSVTYNPRLFVALLGEFVDAKMAEHQALLQQRSATEVTRRVGNIVVTERVEFEK